MSELISNISLIENHLIVFIAYQVYKISLEVKRQNIDINNCKEEVLKIKNKLKV